MSEQTYGYRQLGSFFLASLKQKNYYYSKYKTDMNKPWVFCNFSAGESGKKELCFSHAFIICSLFSSNRATKI
jgi:hypothetical protein